LPPAGPGDARLSFARLGRRTGIEKLVDGLSQIAIEGLDNPQRYIEKPVFSGFFHQLGDA